MSYGNMVESSSALVMNVKRKKPELVRPARPTPMGLKPLSDMDVQEQLRYQPSTILVYPATRGMKDSDPAKMIKAALAEALVYYYPLAGRLRELGPGGELMVDCTAKGVVFVEADADVRVDQLPLLLPPIPYIEELLYNKEANTTAVVGCPLITLQMTKFTCGGLVLAFSNSHIMGDAIGIVQYFLASVTELARGASAPSVLPVWRRELLKSRDTNANTLYPNPTVSLSPADHVDAMPPMVRRLFFFGRREVEALRARLPDNLKSSSSTFELITACLWHCRVLALRYKPHERVRLQFVVNARDVFDPPLPRGYYGNACSHAQVICPAGRVCDDTSLGYVVYQMKKAKDALTDEYVRSLINVMNQNRRRRPLTMSQRLYIVSDVSRVGLLQLDFGWGKPLYAGPADKDTLPGIITYIVAFRNRNGEDGKLVPVWLPVDAMDRFVNALRTLLKNHSKL